MKKTLISLIVTVAFCNSDFTFSGNMGTMSLEPDWTGFYLGANAGYWASQNNEVVTSGSSNFINQTFASGSSNITHALAQVATNNFSLNSYGFIGGGQVGYNYQYKKKFLIGIDADFKGLTNSNNTHSLQKRVNLADYSEEYIASLTIQQKINYLGTVHARLGYLYHPTFLIYATGGFAYGNVTLDTAWIANESSGPMVYPIIISTRKNLNQVLPGWAAGSGVEWFFKTNWSAKFEYTYYCLSKLDAPAVLTQINRAESPSVPWGSSTANTALSASVGTIGLSINYHFS